MIRYTQRIASITTENGDRPSILIEDDEVLHEMKRVDDHGHGTRRHYVATIWKVEYDAARD